MNILKILSSIIVFANLGSVSFAYINLSEYFPSKTSIEYYIPPSTGCAINAVYLAISKIHHKSILIEEIANDFKKFEGPPYSMLDIVSILDTHSMQTIPLKLTSPREVFKYKFKYGILYLKESNKGIGHFSFCFRGKDNKLWIADPMFGNECVEFTSESEVFKLFTGIILKIEYLK